MKRKMMQQKFVLVYMLLFLAMFFCIGVIATMVPSNQLSNSPYTKWTSNLEDDLFIDWLQFENHMLAIYQGEKSSYWYWNKPIWSKWLQIEFTNKLSYLRSEFPGFSTYAYEVIVANEQIENYEQITAESGPPLERVLKDKEAIDDSKTEEKQKTDISEKVVFLYNSHNRESFLPHLPTEKDANDAYHEKVNITKVNDKLASLLESSGIGVMKDDTDISKELNDRGWSFGRSYDVTREVVQSAMASNDTLQYFFDIHRDSLPRDKTTVKIAKKEYASLLFVIGSEHKNYEKNLALATLLHDKLNESYPNISRGVITKQGANSNGIYNQDLNEQAILIEMGGPENTLDEIYDTSEVFAEIFSDVFWEAEKVNKAGE